MSATTLYSSATVDPSRARQVTLLDLVDRLLAGGVVIRGHVMLAAADVDLVEVDLALLVRAIQEAGR